MDFSLSVVVIFRVLRHFKCDCITTFHLSCFIEGLNQIPVVTSRTHCLTLMLLIGEDRNFASPASAAASWEGLITVAQFMY